MIKFITDYLDKRHNTKYEALVKEIYTEQDYDSKLHLEIFEGPPHRYIFENPFANFRSKYYNEAASVAYRRYVAAWKAEHTVDEEFEDNTTFTGK